jgi:D-arabinose 1-dehydrogenase-like Zn-dependent alcohol dehydrogenase
MYYICIILKSVRMMKAAVITSITEPLEIKQVPIPQLGPNEVLVKLIACGVCHSDLSMSTTGTRHHALF